MLDLHERNGMNALIVQVRPAADALYPSPFEPWSEFLTGRQGLAPDPMWDPLKFMITETHKRGMEFHAWLNPYRAVFNLKTSSVSPMHLTRTHPEWFLVYGNRKEGYKKYFNPGLPEVRQHTLKVVKDLVTRYDLDGIHMDDYFYPYQIDGQHINDAETFKTYGSGYNDIKDWRRHNVDTLIQVLSDSIHKHKPRIKFGISPFGIWANRYQNPAGSDTHGGSSNYELFADSRKWIKKGWLDYINPQIYWPIDDRSVPFNVLLDWWSENTYNRHLYIGMAAYRINERKLIKFRDPAQLPDQIKYLRANPRVQGSVYFSSNSLLRNPLGIADSLKETYYRYPALPPPMLWLDSIPPNPVRNLLAAQGVSGVVLKWETPLPAKDKESVYGYVIYRFEGTEKVNLTDPKHILHIQYDDATFYNDNTAQKGKTYLYVVTAIDRLKNESEPSPTVAAIVR